MSDNPFGSWDGNPTQGLNYGGGYNAQAFLQVLQDLVTATNAQAQYIKNNLGVPASGDISGIYPGPITVVDTHLTNPLSLTQGGTGNTSGQPSGSAGGDLLGSTYPNPTVAVGVITSAKMAGGAAATNVGMLAGDLSGSLPNPTVSRINGSALSTTTPTAGNLMVGQGLNWQTKSLSGDAALAATGAITVTKSSGTPFGTSAFKATSDNGVADVAAYQTGTWTPDLQIAASSVGITYGNRSGSWTQIGREVVCYFTLTLTSKGAGVGAVTIAGLPAASSADAAMAGAGGGAVAYANLAALNGAPLIQIGASSSAANLLDGGAAASATLQDTNLTNTSTISGYFRYYV